MVEGKGAMGNRGREREKERKSDVERRKIEKWERKETEGQNERSERRQREVNDYVARVR